MSFYRNSLSRVRVGAACDIVCRAGKRSGLRSDRLNGMTFPDVASAIEHGQARTSVSNPAIL